MVVLDFRKPRRNHDSHSDLGSAACQPSAGAGPVAERARAVILWSVERSLYCLSTSRPVDRDGLLTSWPPAKKKQRRRSQKKKENSPRRLLMSAGRVQGAGLGAASARRTGAASL